MNLGKTFSDKSHTNVFLGQSPKAIEIKAKNKWDLVLVKSFCTGNQKQNEKDSLQPGRK